MTMSNHIAHWNLLIGALSIFLLFIFRLIILAYSGTDSKNPADFEAFIEACQSNYISYCGFALCFSSGAMILDIAIDCFDRHDSSTQSSLLHSKHIWLGRCFFLFATLMVGIQYALQYDYFQTFSISNYYLSFWFATFCHRIVSISTILFFVSISDNDSTSSTFRKTILVNIFGCMATLLQVFDNILHVQSIALFVRLSYVAWLIFSFALFSHHSYQIWKTRDTWEVHNYAHFLYVILFVIMILFIPLASIPVVLLRGKLEYTSTMSIIYSFAIVTIILSVIPGRIARRDAIVSKDHIIATKESYVRYLSHEMRTPMNIMHSGIKLAIDEVSTKAVGCTELDIEEHLDTLVDVKDACETALEILNDFLLYDKLRNGKVELQKKVVCVFDFVSKCLNSFSLQLRSKTIQLQFLNDDNHVYYIPSNSCISEQSNQESSSLNSSSGNSNNSSSMIKTSGNGFNIHSDLLKRHTVQNESYSFSYIRNNDDMCIDESKLSQVIRNLLSNAIKFTPEKGNIQVSMGFVPDTKVEVSHDMNSSIHTTVAGYVYGILENIRSNWSSLINRRGTESDYSLVNNIPASNAQTVDIEAGNPLLNTLSDVSSDEIVCGMLRIEIQDSGVGISPENQTRLFKEVVQFDPDVLQAGGGSGMGLFISKDLVDMHGGRISVYSEGVGKGTTFRLEIPMCRHTQQSYHSSSDEESLGTNSLHDQAVSVIISSQQMASDYAHILDTQMTSSTFINSFTDVRPENRTEVIHTDEKNQPTMKSIQGKESSLILCEPLVHTETQSKVADVNARVLSNSTSLLSSESTNNIYSPLHVHSESSMDNEQQSSTKQSSRSSKTSTTIESIQFSVPRKCLIVDDVSTNRKMLIKHLKGHYCDQAADGDIAVEMVKAITMVVSEAANSTSSSSAAIVTAAELPVDSPLRNYDIIFMDYVMPNMTGPVATKAIRDLGYTGLIYGVTGNSLPVDIATFMTAGATDVIIKPFRKEDLLRIGLFSPDSS